SSGTAVLYRRRRGIIEGRAGDRLKRLKRKENATIVSLEFVSVQKSAIQARRKGEATAIWYCIDFPSPR
ncbi:MAG: hypothetical protein WAU79_10410, partial [Bradyrhizobium sp.]|uniref:hypothetical protein n=1 Tax=Bradyrhizobium sp. TaxID=376 RepID=UPI003BAE2DE1